MSDLQVGDSAPNFTLPTDAAETITLSELLGRPVILYFYPKDDTPGCTKQACGFNDILPDLKSLDVHIIGISKDSVKKHAKFKEKYSLNFPLASDENSEICEHYGVWKEKSMYGRKYMGIERTTFLIDDKGNIAYIWRKVKVTGHIETVKVKLEELMQS